MDNKDLLQKLAACAAACENCMDKCLGEEHVKMMVNCIRTDRDCAKICYLTASFVASNSRHVGELLTQCAELCRVCAEECEKHEDDHCQECARACRACEEACKDYEPSGF